MLIMGVKELSIIEKKSVEKRFINLNTRQSKREFALKLAKKINYPTELLSYDKLSEFTITVEFYNMIGIKYTHEDYMPKDKRYRPTFQRKRTF